MATAESIRKFTLTPPDNKRLAKLCGQFDENLHLIERRFGVEINNRGHAFEIIGIPSLIDKACYTIQQLYEETSLAKDALTPRQIQLTLRSINMQQEISDEKTKEKLAQAIIKLPRTTVKPLTQNQRHYIHAIQNYDINFGIGPSGTGKTFLAVACAIASLNKEEVNRIILVRPAVEAGESLGFLPGDLTQKIDPYLRPLYDSLYEMLGIEKVTQMIAKGIIEVAPLAYMRGRTLNDSFIILDEGQNTTKDQMKMFLTRIGFASKAVITGDITQIDLPKKTISGLRHATTLLSNISAIQFSFFTSVDVVRHTLVQKIIEAYEKERG